jgi:dehydrogenase/reductase SDR family member 7B
MMKLSNQVIWITGASSGIGEALAIACSHEGAKLVLSARREDELQRVKKSCSNPDNILVLPFDLSETSEFRNHVAKVIARFGRIDVLVNNGGISQRALARETDEITERKIMDLNYFSNIRLTQAVLPEMRGQQSGKIVVISSIAGKFGFYLRSSYSASKFALHGYYESLRLEEEDAGVSVMMVCPGRVQTNISLNALKADGTHHGKMDSAQAEGIPAAKCAQDIIHGILKNKKEIFSGGSELRAIWAKKWLPRIFERAIRKQKPY